MRTTTPLVLVALLAIALVPPPAAAHMPCEEGRTCGVIPVGTGGATANAVDHRRHLIPERAVGIVVEGVIISEGPLPNTWARFARLTTCPPDMACTENIVDPPCLVVYARAGSVGTPYTFRWTADPDEATLLLSQLPFLWSPTAPRGLPDGVAC